MATDEDDWSEIERPPRSRGFIPDVAVSMFPGGPDKLGKIWRPGVWIVFRNDAAVWIESKLRFRVSVGGSLANRLRLFPCDDGPFETWIMSGVSRMRLSMISAWPCERRLPTAAKWRIEDDAMILTLPEDWAEKRSK